MRGYCEVLGLAYEKRRNALALRFRGDAASAMQQGRAGDRQAAEATPEQHD